MALCRMKGKYFWFRNYYAYSSVHIITFHLHTDPPKVSPASIHEAMSAWGAVPVNASTCFYASVLNTGQWQLSFLLLTTYCLFPKQEFWVRLTQFQNLANSQILLSSVVSVMAPYLCKGKKVKLYLRRSWRLMGWRRGGDEWSTSRPGRFTPQERIRVPVE